MGISYEEFEKHFKAKELVFVRLRQRAKVRNFQEAYRSTWNGFDGSEMELNFKPFDERVQFIISGKEVNALKAVYERLSCARATSITVRAMKDIAAITLYALENELDDDGATGKLEPCQEE